MTFFEMYEINPSLSRGQRVSERNGETTEPFNIVYLVLNKKIFSSDFFLISSVLKICWQRLSNIFIFHSKMLSFDSCEGSKGGEQLFSGSFS